jgi:hypothetical protein
MRFPLWTRDRAPKADAVHAGAAPLGALVYELLDAHADTADLADGLESDPRWAQHLDYLRALQRTGREALAHASREDPA